MRSIRGYLLTRLLGGAAVLLAIAGAALYFFLSRSLEAQFDRNLTDRVQGLASILFQHQNEVSFEFSDELMPEYEREEDPAYFQLSLPDFDLLLENSNSLGEGELAVEGEPGEHPRHWTAPLPDGRQGRFVAQIVEIHHVYPEEGPDRPEAARVLIVIARSRGELLAAERRVLLGCAAGALTLLLMLAVLSWRAVIRGLEPARRLANEVERIEMANLPKSLDVGHLPGELAPMAEKTDDLIQRARAALERERRTAADIAHELRTPISELVTVAEVALRDSRDEEGSRQALGMVRDVAWRMGRSVSTLLKLARLEMGTDTYERTGVDLNGIVRRLGRSLAPLGEERRVTLDNRLRAGELVEGDPDVLEIVAANLLENAFTYSAPGDVVCELTIARTGWRFSVENRAPDLQPEDLTVLSEPFWRKDGARTDCQRSGLGLALSQALAASAGMSLGFELEGDRFRAVIAGTGASSEREGADGYTNGNGRASAPPNGSA